MLDILLKQMLPPGFDLGATIAQVQTAIQTTVATVQRIEQSQLTILSRLDAIQAGQDATVTLSMIGSNDDHKQPAGTPSNPASAAAGTDSAGSGDSRNGQPYAGQWDR